MRVLVHVESHRESRLRGTVGCHPAEIVAERQVIEAHSHPTHGRRPGNRRVAEASAQDGNTAGRRTDRSRA
ncbi:hypothetical protein MTES_0292 [Microbacterium testaceum StLB037]|uniref:Uncharacterized protein n=1 Tax=Microbacterium testaceum (strain StLB037) TaxID=979556 RepID=E8N9K9_MICTS|nr:hypothetical protein MTES_0292 [Microbacterium testaceum StLB037]